MVDVYELSSDGTPPRSVSAQRRITKLEREIKEMKDVIRILWGKIIGRTYSASRLTWKQLHKAVLYPLNGEQVRELRDGTQLSADFEQMLMNKMAVLEKKIDMMTKQIEALRKQNIKSQVDSAFEEPQNDLPDFSDEVFKDTAQAYIFPEQDTVAPKMCPPKKSFFTSPSIRFNPSFPHAVKKFKTKALPGCSEHALIDASENRFTSNFLDLDYDAGETLPVAATAADPDISSPTTSNAHQTRESFVPTKRALIYSTPITDNADNSKKLPISSAINTSKTRTSALFASNSPFSVLTDDNHALTSSSQVKKSLDLTSATSKDIVKQKKTSRNYEILPSTSTPSTKEKSNSDTLYKPLNLERPPSNAMISHKRKNPSNAMLRPSANLPQEVTSSDEIPVEPCDLEDNTFETVINHKRKNPSNTMLRPSLNPSQEGKSCDEIPFELCNLEDKASDEVIRNKRKISRSTELVQPSRSSLGERSHPKVSHESLTPSNVIRRKRRNPSSTLLGSPPRSAFEKLGTLTHSETTPKSPCFEDTSNIIVQYKRENQSSAGLNASPLVERLYTGTTPESPDLEIPTSKVIIKHKRRNPSSLLLDPCRSCTVVERSRAVGSQQSLDSGSTHSDVIPRERASPTTSSSPVGTHLKEKYNTKNPQVSHALELIKRGTFAPESSIFADSPTVSENFNPELGLEERPSVSKDDINKAKYIIKHKRRNPNICNIYSKSSLFKERNEISPPLLSCEEMFDKLLTSTPISKTSCTTLSVQSKPLEVVSNTQGNHGSSQKFISLKDTPQEFSDAEFPSQERISQIIQMASTSMLKTPSISSQPDENEQIKPSGVEMFDEPNDDLSTTRSLSCGANDAERVTLPSRQVDSQDKEDESSEGVLLAVGGSSDSSY